MADPKIKYDIEANAIGGEEVKVLADAVKNLGDALENDLKSEADAAAAALQKLGAQSAAANAFQQVGDQALQAGAAFKDAQNKLQGLDQKFADASAAAASFAAAESLAAKDVRTTTRELDGAKVALAQVDAAYDKSGRSTSEYTVATGALRVGIATLTADLREKKNTLQDAANAAKVAEREEASLAQQQQKLAVEVGRTRKAYQDSNSALEGAKEKLAAVGVDAGKFAAEQVRLANETDLARKAVVGLTTAFTGMAAAKTSADETAAAATAAGQKISTAFGTLGVRSAAELRAEIAQVRAAMQTVEKDAGLTGKSLQQAMGAGNTRIRELQRELRAAQGELTLTDRAAGALRSGLGQIAGGNVIANAIGGIAAKAKDLGREFLDANLQIEGMRRALTAVYKDANVTASQIDFLRKTANDAGVSTGGLADSFKSFAAATQAANIPLETTNALFAGVTQAGATLGLSGERVGLVLQALGQMASKGTVSMEELRQQLGESLPGALTLAAKGLGLTEAQLIKLVEAGGLASRDLFPALAKSLQELKGETEGVTSTWARFKNALNLASQNAGDAGSMQVLTFAIQALGSVVAVVVLPLTAFSEVIFGLAKSAGVLVGAIATLSNPMEELGKIADAASARQRALADTFKRLIFGADAAAASQAATGVAMAQTGRDATSAAGAIAQVAQAHAAAGAGAQNNAAAQTAAAVATGIAANASLDAGGKWVQLGVQLRAIALAQDQQVKNSEKLAAAVKIEGDGLQALASLRGNDLELLQASSEAAQAGALALDKVAAAREAHLATVKAELEAKKALVAGSVAEQKAREVELQEIQKKVDALDAEAAAGRAAAESAKNDASARRAAVGAYQDNAAAVGALRVALENATIVQEAFESDRRKGLANDVQVSEAKRRAAEAQRLYNDALNDAVAAEERKGAANASRLQIERAGLDLAMAQARAAEAKAVADQNDYAVTQARIKQKEIEIAILKLTATVLTAEADAMDEVTNKKIEALILQGKWTDALAAENQLLRQSADLKRVQSAATKEGIAELEQQMRVLRGYDQAAESTSKKSVAATERMTAGWKEVGAAAQGAGRSASQAADENAKAIDEINAKYGQSKADRDDRYGPVGKTPSRVGNSRDTTFVNVLQSDVNQAIAKRYGDSAVGNKTAEAAYSARLQLESYQRNYGNSRSMQSMEQQRNYAAELARLEKELEAERTKTNAQAPGTPGKTIVNLSYNGAGLGSVSTDSAGRSALEQFMQALANDRSTAR